VAADRRRGAPVTIAFGGQAGTELAVASRTGDRLLAAYRSVIDRYHQAAIDMDLEGDALADPATVTRRAGALAALQPRSHHTTLPIWLTLPATPAGLTANGARGFQSALTAGVHLAGMNIPPSPPSSVTTTLAGSPCGR
jgi:chitinase